MAAAAELPKKYKAAVYDKPGSISTKIEELDMPEPGPGEVLINLYVHGKVHNVLITYNALMSFPMHLLTRSQHPLRCLPLRHGCYDEQLGRAARTHTARPGRRPRGRRQGGQAGSRSRDVEQCPCRRPSRDQVGFWHLRKL
jgi:hypothetical protein